MSGRDLFLTGVGLCCSLGPNAADSLQAYRRRMPAFRKATDMVGIDGLPPTLAALIPVAECRDYPQRLYRLLELARDDLQTGDGRSPTSIHVLLPRWIEAHPARDEVAGLILDAFGQDAPRATLVFGGPTHLLTTLSTLAEQLEPDEVALVAAIDSYMQTDLLDALAVSGRMLARGNPYGSVPSEAAVVLRVAGRPTPTSCCIVGIIEGREIEDVRAPKGLIGRGLASVVRQTAAMVTDRPGIGRLMIGLTGERWRAEECGFALSAAGLFLGDLTRDLEAPLSMTGDCGVASTALMLALAVAERDALNDPLRPRTLLLDASRSGERAACIIEPVREAT